MKKKKLIISLLLLLVITSIFCLTSIVFAKWTGYVPRIKRYPGTEEDYWVYVSPETTIKKLIEQVENYSSGTFGSSAPDAKRVVSIERKGKIIYDYNNENDMTDKDWNQIIMTGDIITEKMRNPSSTNANWSRNTTILVYGDINGDGKYSYKDVLLLSNYLKGEEEGGSSTTVASLDNGLWIGDSIAVNLNLYNNIEQEYSSVVWGHGGKTPGYFLSSEFGLDDKINNLDLEPSYIYIILGNNISSTGMDDLKTLVTKLQGYYPDIPIFIQSNLPANSLFTNANYANYTATMNEQNEIIKEFCDETEGVNYVYVLDGYIDSDGYTLPGMDGGDGLHPSREGSNLLFENIKNAIVQN